MVNLRKKYKVKSKKSERSGDPGVEAQDFAYKRYKIKGNE